MGQAAEDLENLAYGREVQGWPEDWHRVGLAKLGAGLIRRAEADSKSTISVQLARIALELQRPDLARAWLVAEANDHSQRRLRRSKPTPIIFYLMILL